MMVSISVIISVYNVENYLRDCLDSIVNQTLDDIEIICINDGSTDGSINILKEYAKKDNRITIILQKNSGYAIATNRGIELASGKYLFLMDSSNVLELNALELSYNKAEDKNIDFVLFKSINYDSINNRYYESEAYSMNNIYKIVSDNVFNYTQIGDLIFQANVTPWSKLYKKDFIMKYNIRFPEGLIFGDNVFFYEALFNSKRICFLDKFLFIHRWYSTSSTTSGDLCFLDSITIYNLIIDVFQRHGLYEKYKKQLLNNKLTVNLMRYRKIKPEFRHDYFIALKKDFIRMFNDKKLFDDLKDNLSYENKKIFTHILLSSNSDEYQLLRNTYNMEMKQHETIKKLSNNHINNLIQHFNNSKGKEKIYYYNNMKEIFVEILENKECYEFVMQNIRYNDRKIFEQILISNNIYEFMEIRKYCNKFIERNTLKNEFIDKLKKQNSNLKEENKLVQNKYDKLNERNTLKNEFIDKLKKQITDLKKENKLVQNKYDKLNERNTLKNEFINKLKEENINLKKRKIN